MLVQEANAILLSGGSAFGLAAADGVVSFLEEAGIGFDTQLARVPIVPAAVLFDLGVGDARARPGAAAGRAACEAASDGDVAEGNVGAGTGATVAKLFGIEHAVKGGLGTASVDEGGLIVGALAAVNALGEVVGADGAVLAGSRAPDRSAGPGQPGNTTLVVVATNATLSRERAHLLAQAAHEGISAAVRPAHTIWDGDTVFALATGGVEAEQRAVEALAVTATGDAIRRAVLAADGVPGFPQAREVPT
jgi:L-aminopeptidase/D-esterase-like protein